jgi:hypothetical protein
VDIRKNKKEAKREMNDGMPEVIKGRLSTKGFKRGISFLHRISRVIRKFRKIQVSSVSF